MANAKISDFLSDRFVDSKKKLSILSDVAAKTKMSPLTVTSAVKMSAAQEKEVAAAVKAIVGGDAAVDLKSEVDADIVGGLIVSIGDKYTTMQHIDLSTSSKIQKFSGLLKQGV